MHTVTKKVGVFVRFRAPLQSSMRWCMVFFSKVVYGKGNLLISLLLIASLEALSKHIELLPV
jgi:hypothetical protein